MDETKHPHTPHPGHETTDVNVWAVGKFAIGLVVVCVVSIALLWGLLKFFQSQEATSVANYRRAHQALSRSLNCRRLRFWISGPSAPRKTKS